MDESEVPNKKLKESQEEKSVFDDSCSFWIQSKHNALVITVDPVDKAVKVLEREEVANPCQTWRITNDGFLVSLWNSQVLTVSGTDKKKGSKIVLRSKSDVNNDHQKWLLVDDGHLKSRLNEFCVDIYDDDKAAGSQVWVWPERDHAWQKWKLIQTAKEDDAISNATQHCSDTPQIDLDKNNDSMEKENPPQKLTDTNTDTMEGAKETHPESDEGKIQKEDEEGIILTTPPLAVQQSVQFKQTEGSDDSSILNTKSDATTECCNVYESPMFQSLCNGKEFLHRISYDLFGVSEELGLDQDDITDDFREWDFCDSLWDKAKAQFFEHKICQFILPYGKYCVNKHNTCAWRTWFELSSHASVSFVKPSVFDVFKAVTMFYKQIDEIDDGHFLVGFEVSEDGTWCANFEA